MPGLVGIISLNWKDRIDLTHYEKMCQSIFHRKWYKRMDVFAEEGNYAISRIHHGIVNNLEKPVSDPDADVTVILEGEIYNDLQAGQSESEYILNLYLIKDDSFIEKLDGSFIIVIIDNKKKKILIANDRTASRPFFYFYDNKNIYFSPEVKAFFAIPSFKKTINNDAVWSYLCSGYLVNRLTYFKNIKTIENSCVIKIENNTVTEKKYFDFCFIEKPTDKGLNYYVNTSIDLIQQAVEKRLKGGYRFGITLSGGVDSRAILGGFVNSPKSMQPTTITWGEKEDLYLSDEWCAKALSDKVNSKHVFFTHSPEKIIDNIHEVVFLNEGLTDSVGNYPEGLDIFNKIRSEHAIDILFRGDQCFSGGLMVFSKKDLLPKFSILPFSSISPYKNLINKNIFDEFLKTNKLVSDQILSRSKSSYLHNRKDYLYLDQRLISYLNPLSWLKQVEIEQRNPLIDNDFMEFVFQVPFKYRIDKRFFYLAVSKAFPMLSSIPIATIESEINWDHILKNNNQIKEYVREIFFRNDNSFYEFVNKKDLAIFVESVFSQKQEIKNYYSSNIINSLKRSIKKIGPLVIFLRKFKKTWVLDDTHILLRLLYLKIWFDIFIDGGSFARNH